MPKKIPEGAPRKTLPRKPLDQWDKEARRVLKLEMLRKAHTPETLAGRLVDLGYAEKPKVLAQRIARGSFNSGFLLRALRAMGVDSLDISYVEVHRNPRRR